MRLSRCAIMRATAILNTIRRFLLFLNRKPIEGPGTSYQIGSPRVERASPLPSRTLQRQSVTAAVGLVAFLAFAMFSISCGGEERQTLPRRRSILPLRVCPPPA